MSSQVALKQLFELRVVLERLGEGGISLQETLAHDLERALKLTDSCIAHLTDEDPGTPDPDAEGEE
jgi:hypothetical protein